MAQQNHREIRLCHSQRRASEAPILTLEGLWLQKAGFNIGDLVQITPKNERLNHTLPLKLQRRPLKIIEKWK